MGHGGVVRLLIDNGADVSAARNKGKTPLYWASRNRHEAVVRLLVDNDASLTAATQGEVTPSTTAPGDGQKISALLTTAHAPEGGQSG